MKETDYQGIIKEDKKKLFKAQLGTGLTVSGAVIVIAGLLIGFLVVK